MANQDFFTITERLGEKPVELVVGENPDGDTRYRIDITYNYHGEQRRRVWNTHRQLETLHALLDSYLYGNGRKDSPSPPSASPLQSEAPGVALTAEGGE